MSAVAPTLGVLAGLVGLASMLPYLRDTLRRVTRPHRGTWVIWALLGLVVCASQRADGASWSLAMTGAQVAANLAVVVLAVRCGTGGVTAAEAVVAALAGAGVAGWFMAGEPLVAVACVVAGDLVAAGMMLPKTWRSPRSETLSTYGLGSVAGALALGSVGALEPSLLLYPLYYCLVNAALALVIRHRRAASTGRPGPVLVGPLELGVPVGAALGPLDGQGVGGRR